MGAPRFLVKTETQPCAELAVNSGALASSCTQEFLSEVENIQIKISVYPFL